METEPVAPKGAGALQPHPADVGSGKELDAKAGNQRVKRRDGLGTSRGSESRKGSAFKGQKRGNVGSHHSGQRLDFLM